MARRRPAGRVDTTSIIGGVDILPTVLAVLQIPTPPNYQSDGCNAVSAFRGERFDRSAPLFWEWRGPHKQLSDWPTHAMRDGDFVLLHDETFQRIELYNVHQDREQSNNLADREGSRVQAMKAQLDAWRATLPTPFKQSPDPSLTRAGSEQKSSPPTTTQPDRSRESVFKRWDKNNDGQLTLQEYTDGLAKKRTPRNASRTSTKTKVAV